MRQELILQQYNNFNVYQLMRLLLAEQPNSPIEKRFRFRADLSLAFPAHEFSSITVHKPRRTKDKTTSPGIPGDAEIIEIQTANYSLAGILGPLPEPFAEWVRDLKQASEPAMADFLDVFNQRLNILRYQLKRAQTIGLNSVAPEMTDQAKALSALAGLGLQQIQQQIPMAPRSWLSLAGLLANCRKSAATVVHVLNLLLNTKQDPEKTKVSLIPLIGAWKSIETDDRVMLGQRNQQLGKKTVLGRAMWDQQARVRIVIDHIDFPDFCKLLPGSRIQNLPNSAGAYYQRFSGILLLLLDCLVDCEIELNVNIATIPRGRKLQTMRLSQTAWLNSDPRKPRSPPKGRVCYLVPANESSISA
ncbi:type VI secretion system baseplate subunit TssG [Undibacterium sp. Xuan67W]|uniref:type VI secretion system baseplate subunit TssG n=1 Tax=Undibacterium sp. Xuan67W TaxID=3413057 RepID=UPI003BF3D1D5